VTQRAVVIKPEGPFGLGFDDVPEPAPAADEAVVAVSHVSVNVGDLLAGRMFPAGTVVGFDLSGVVVAPAADGSGPAAGTRVVALSRGSWTQRKSVRVKDLAEVPAAVSLESAATLPVAGLTALRALWASGPTVGRRVLVTGASGGVGRFAVALATAGGARVIASVGAPERGAGLKDLGAEVVVGLDEVAGPIHTVIETVGGAQLARAFQLLSPGGVLQSIGWASGEPAVLEPYSFYGPAKTLTPFVIEGDVGDDLATLLGRVADGVIRPEIGWRGGWENFAEAATALERRTVAGKAVLTVDPTLAS
jgi:NADPH2:quinone reductase